MIGWILWKFNIGSTRNIRWRGTEEEKENKRRLLGAELSLF